LHRTARRRRSSCILVKYQSLIYRKNHKVDILFPEILPAAIAAWRYVMAFRPFFSGNSRVFDFDPL
jgi:hypothetical protein